MSCDRPPALPAAFGREEFGQLVAAVAEALAVPLLLDGIAARKYLGLSKSGWHRARSAGVLPSPVYVEGAGDRYRRSDLDRCVERLKARRTRRAK